MGGPNSINSNNPIRGGGFNPRQEGAQAPDLKQFALTIDDFRQFAAGKFNAGAVSGERAGVHRTWERLESTDIDPTEAASIRLAFAFALEDAGVSGAKLVAACKRLGLESDFSFSENDAKIYTSLSRKEVRDIIDQSLGGKIGQAEPHKAEGPKLLEIDGFEIIENVPQEERNIINEIDDESLFKNHDEPHLSSNSRKSEIAFKKNDVKIGKNDLELDEKQRKIVANSNFGTIVNAILDEYGEDYHLEQEEIADLVRRVDGWEDKLAKCELEKYGTKLPDLNQDLKDFILYNEELKGGLEELLGQKKAAK